MNKVGPIYYYKSMPVVESDGIYHIDGKEFKSVIETKTYILNTYFADLLTPYKHDGIFVAFCVDSKWQSHRNYIVSLKLEALNLLPGGGFDDKIFDNKGIIKNFVHNEKYPAIVGFEYYPVLERYVINGQHLKYADWLIRVNELKFYNKLDNLIED